MARTREGDREAFAEIVDRHKDAMVNYLTRLTGDRDRAEDAAQETFVRLYENASRYREEGHMAAFLYRIATNLVRTENRKQRRRQILRGMFGPNGNGGPPNPQAALLRDEAANQLAAALEALPLTFRAPLVMREVEGLSYQDIAEITGTREGTVKSRINRGRLRLRELLSAYWSGGVG